MAATGDEKLFVTSYLQLVSLTNPAEASTFNSPRDYDSLESLGPSLPTFSKLKLPSNSKQAELVGLSFKSIKPPYKFQTELTSVPNSDSIFAVKSKLIDSLKLNEQHIKPSDLKFLIKGKVIQDNTLLSALDNYSFMCMVTPPAPQTTNTNPTDTTSGETVKDSDPDIAIDDVANLQVEQETWEKIHSILKQDLKNDVKALTVLDKFKASI